MFSGGRYFYSVFMCHLSIKKALKGLYQNTLNETPPRTHNLVFLLSKANLRPPIHLGKIIVKLNEANIITRYPEKIDTLQKEYTKSIVSQIISQSKEVLIWIKEQF